MNHELFHRYQDSYRAAARSVGFGNGIRAFGLLAGIGAVIWGLIMMAQGCSRCGVWLMGGGVVVALVLSILGVLLATQGRILRGTLDSAVSANRTLSQHEQAQLMNMEG